MKKLLMLVLTFILIVPMTLVLTACGENGNGGNGGNGDGTALFNADGTTDSVQAAAILNSTNRAESFRLFPNIGSAGSHQRNLSELNWRVVHRDNYSITFWAEKSYRVSTFRNSEVDYSFNQFYYNSIARKALLADFGAILNGVSDLYDVLLPIAFPSDEHVCRYDLITLPARHEVGVGDDVGMWNLTEQLRTPAELIGLNAPADWSLLRTVFAGFVNAVSPQGGRAQNADMNFEFGIRPAIRICASVFE